MKINLLLMRFEFSKDALHLWIKVSSAILSVDGRRNVFCFDSSLFDVEGLDLLMIPPASGCCIYFSAHSENSQSR